MYISYYPDLAAPGATDAIRAFTELAVRSGVRRLVLLSGRGEPEAQRCEEIVMSSGAQWTVLRCSWFNQNFSENYLLEPILAGEVALPASNVVEPFVDADDIADAAVAALTDDKHVGQLYELTGPKLLTFAEAIGQIARASGREIRYVQISMDDYVAALEQAQLPADLIALIKYLFTEVLDGRNAYITDGVQRALGRAPTEFGEYARRAAASGAWVRESKQNPPPRWAGEGSVAAVLRVVLAVGRASARLFAQFQSFRVRKSRTSRSASS